MTTALIGYSGFVGSTLLKQAHFEELFRSTNINEIKGKQFKLVVCAGAPAQKWIANSDPESDKQKIESLIASLDTITCDIFILISTVDVFKNSQGVNENSLVDTDNLHAYGLNRYRLEQFVQQKFPNHLIVRLPGLIGPGLRKNIIYDFHNDNNVAKIESRNKFQFYPMVNLWYDINIALQNNIKLLHLTASPVAVSEIAKSGFGFVFNNPQNSPLITYDMQTIHADLFEGYGNYQYSAKESLQAVRHYAQSEPKNKPE
ncbi:pyridine nucleotide transhydrogenase [Atlantibacter sp.]|uniref:pyridine nucleotide transhydrogenase n=1 Tax=Atlantibacter sp. TaxID=1903473 RepID=UPI00289D84C3|nr:pyridine nucleotide transhydrogenase [Atlantibacter sp.]